ncbi:septum formation protein Maf [Syntrophotalea acetylenivorans]|uniref:dTTP/UTP pyrophosphatase n=1 Tax=Syntrophotalea acetylenivorans TaxID=1842532 RepID=A0A1L3GPI4_9BACT|nr:Maf family nucleotide pyrophosphatase [Syntrophotalea acetylenivorans]APG27847.1 septum formation protein Maf [Syntrophotalea acetylenivorans]
MSPANESPLYDPETPLLILASASPRRKDLLSSLGIDFQVVPSQAAETLLANESPRQHVMRLSREKALEVARRKEVPGRWFLGSDTVVLRDETILGKPADAREASTMLHSLSGRSHQVLSGYAIYDRITEKMEVEAVTTRVRFKELTDREIAGYIATGEPFGKAGSYAIQGIGAFMIPAIEGSYSNVVGLPLCEVVAALERLGALRLFANAE